MMLSTREQKQLALFLYGKLDSVEHPEPKEIAGFIAEFFALSLEAKNCLPKDYNVNDAETFRRWIKGK